MSGGCNDIGVVEGGGDDTRRDKSGDVGNVDNEVGTDRVGDLAHAGVVDQTAVGRGTSDEDLGTVQLGVLLERVVVNDTGLNVDSVGHGLEVGRHGRDPAVVVSRAVQHRIPDQYTYFFAGVW